MYLFPTATAYGYVHSIFIGFSSAIQSILFYGDTAIWLSLYSTYLYAVLLSTCSAIDSMTNSSYGSCYTYYPMSRYYSSKSALTDSNYNSCCSA